MPAKPPSPSPTPSASSRHSTGPCSPGRAWNGSWASRGPGGDVDADLRAELTGNQRTLPKPQFLRQLPKHRARAAFRGEGERRARLVAELRKARVTGIRVTLPVETLDAKLASLPEGVSVFRDRIEVRFNGAKEAVERLYALAYALVNDYERFEGLVDGGVGGGERCPSAGGRGAGGRRRRGSRRRSANERTRAAYAQAVGQRSRRSRRRLRAHPGHEGAARRSRRRGGCARGRPRWTSTPRPRGRGRTARKPRSEALQIRTRVRVHVVRDRPARITQSDEGYRPDSSEIRRKALSSRGEGRPRARTGVRAEIHANGRTTRLRTRRVLPPGVRRGGDRRRARP